MLFDELPDEVGMVDVPQDKCPMCGSEDISSEDGPNNGFLEVQCFDCGYKWIEPCTKE